MPEPTEPQVPMEPTEPTEPQQVPDVQAQMAQLSEAMSAIAQSQQQLQETAQSMMQAQQPQQRYLSQVEQGQVQQPQTDWDSMTQGEMVDALRNEVFGKMNQAFESAGSQYGQMIQTINPEWDGFQPGMREGMQGMLQQGMSFPEAYGKMKELTAARTKTEPDGTSQADIEAKVNAGVKAVLDKQRALRAGVAQKPGRTGAEKAKLTPAEQFSENYQKMVVEGEELDPKFTRGL